MFRRRHCGNHGFSLLELVIVVVIIGIIAAIAIPRLSRGSAGAADSALSGNLAVLRNALDLYAAEHDGKFPTLLNIEAQLTQFTDVFGAAQPGKDATHIYGPYIRKVPPLPVGGNRGSTTFTDVLGGAGFGWFYDSTLGVVKANCPDAEVDATGKKYNEY